MSDKIFPFQEWPEGIAQASVPANDNSLRVEALSRPCLGTSNNPSTPTDGDVWIVGSSPTGAFASFQTNDIALVRLDVDNNPSWYAWAPVEGLRLTLDDGSIIRYIGESTNEWQNEGGGGGAVVPPVVTESGTNLDATGSNDGNYTRFTSASAKTYTFDDAESFTTGAEYHGRNVGAGDLTITEAGAMTINPPAGGTLVIPQGGTFTVKIVASDEADLFGVTVAA